MQGRGALTAVAVEQVTKVHRRGDRTVSALEDVSFRVQRGQAIALLGHNGAGKSSLLRILAGRDQPQSGRALVLGHDLRHGYAGVAHRVGALVDQPGFLSGLSGQANLEIAARRHGLGGAPVHDALDRCGLGPVGRRRVVSTYSLGMRQRLGIAAALLGDPELLLLDEPTNGLDPAGIAWVRDLLRATVHAGRTVVLASHLLGEVEATCDQVVVLRAGRVAHAGAMETLASAVSVPMRVRVHGDPEAAARALGRAGLQVQLRRGNDLHLHPTPEQLRRVSLALAQAGIAVLALEPTSSHLEALLGGEGCA